MKTAKQWIDESNWSEELKELFWERAEASWVQRGYLSLEEAVYVAFTWSDTPEGEYFWADVVEGKRTDIDRPKLLHSTVAEMYGLPTDKEYETLVRKLLEGLKGKELRLKGEELSSSDDAFARGFNTGIREMNEKIDEAIKELEI